MAQSMVELGLCIEDAVNGDRVDATGRALGRWAASRPSGWALAYVGCAVWADRGRRLLDACPGRDVWLPDVAADLERGACVVLSALLDGADGPCDELAMLIAARCDGAVLTAAALGAQRGVVLGGGSGTVGWEHVRPVFVCAAVVMRRVSREHGGSGSAFGQAMDLPPRG